MLQKFVNSDEGLPCVNVIEKVYIGLLVIVFTLGLVSLVRLSYYKAEIRKVFDQRSGFTTENNSVRIYNFFTIIFDFKNSYL